MKRTRTFIAGLVAGLVLGAAGAVFAAGNEITAFLAENVSFKVDDRYVSPPSDQTPLMYENRNYVPARFLLEAVGATVDWEEDTRTVVVTSPEPIIEEKIVYIEREPEEEDDDDTDDKTEDNKKDDDKHTYQETPLRITKEGLEVSVRNLARFGSLADSDIVIYKQADQSILVDYLNAKLIVDGKEYITRNISSGNWDMSLINQIDSRDTEINGTLVFPPFPSNADKVILEFDITKVDTIGRQSDPITFRYYIKYKHND